MHGYGTGRIKQIDVQKYRLEVEGGLDDWIDRDEFTGSAAFYLDQHHGTPVTSAGPLQVVSIGQLPRSVKTWGRLVTPKKVSEDTEVLHVGNPTERRRIKELVQSSLQRAIPENRYTVNRLDTIIHDEIAFGGQDSDFAAHRKHLAKVQVASDGSVLLHVDSGYHLRSTQTLDELYAEGNPEVEGLKVAHDTTRYGNTGTATVEGWSDYNYTDHITEVGSSIAECHEGDVTDELREQYIDQNPRLLTVKYGSKERYQLPHFLALSPRTEQVEDQDRNFHNEFTTQRAMEPEQRYQHAKLFIDDLAPLPVFDIEIEPGPTNHAYEFISIRDGSLRLTFRDGKRARSPKAGLRDYGVYRSPGEYRIGFLYPPNYEDLKDEFVPALLQGLVELKAPGRTSAYEYELGDIANYTGVYQQMDKETDVAVALVPNKGATRSFEGVEDPFHELKRTLQRQHIPTQMLEKSTAEDILAGGGSTANNSFLNILSGVISKAGGTPWQISNMPGETDVFLALDVTRDPKTNQHAGASASVVMKDGTVFAAESTTLQSGEKFDSKHVGQFLRDLHGDIKNEFGVHAGRIGVFRDGKLVENIPEIRDRLKGLNAEFDFTSVRKNDQPRVARFDGSEFKIADKGVAFVDDARDRSILHSFGKPEIQDNNSVGTPRTLGIRKHSGPTDIETLTRQAYWLSEVHYGSPARSTRLPVPIKYADMAAEFVRKGFASPGELITGPAYI
jgi:hypothetical protein